MILHKILGSAALIHTSNCAFHHTLRRNLCIQLRGISWAMDEVRYFSIYHSVLEVLYS